MINISHEIENKTISLHKCLRKSFNKNFDRNWFDNSINFLKQKIYVSINGTSFCKKQNNLLFY